MIRKIAFVAIAFNLEDSPGIQLVLTNLMNLACCIYYGKIKPYNTRFRTRLDYFNEFSITEVTWHMMFFTNFVPTQDL